MTDYYPDAVLLLNPPWAASAEAHIESIEAPSVGIQLSTAAMGIRASELRPTYTDLNSYSVVNFDACLTDLLRSKLDSIDISQSVELNRQVLLARHETPQLRLLHAQAEVVESTICSPLSVYTIPRQPYCADILSYDSFRPVQNPLSEFFPSAYAFEFAQLLLLHVISRAIDAIVDYWNAIAEARNAWLIALIAFRQQRRCRLGFKHRHAPLRIIPASIHPIEQAA